MPVYSYMFDRRYPDMIWHVYTGMFMLQCLSTVYLYMFDRCSPDMSSGQEMTSVEQKSLLLVSMF